LYQFSLIKETQKRISSQRLKERKGYKFFHRKKTAQGNPRIASRTHPPQSVGGVQAGFPKIGFFDFRKNKNLGALSAFAVN
jgi:hypothetical protein